MRSKILLVLIVLSFFVRPTESFAQVNVQDSLALVDFYNSVVWRNPENSWNLNMPVKSWEGIRLTNNRVTGIQLWGFINSGKIPSSFGNLTELNSIDLLDCKLTDSTLPESFSNLINLRSLKMHAVFYLLPFPTCVTKLPNLTTLDFEDNLFTDSLPSSIGNMTQLTSLNVGNCFINSSKIPSELGNLKNLTELLLYRNNFSGTIPVSLTDIDSLSGLDLSLNDLYGNIPAGLSNLKNLDYLSLNYNHFTFKEIEPFVKTINESNKAIKYLNLSPQPNIPITFYPDSAMLAVSPGGTLSNNTFKWYKVGEGLVTTITGDSTYTPNTNGKYYVDVTNSIATGVTLSSDTINYDYLLPDTTTTTTQNIKSTDITYVNIGIFRLASIKPIAGDNALEGDLSVTVTINPFTPLFDKQFFVDRHYDITPVENADKAEAIITLYFTQEDFDKFNTVVTTNNQPLPLLPTGGVDNGHIRVVQFHGTYDSTSKKYSGSYVEIIPTVVWNSDNNWWEVSFPVTGFSGFYLTTTNTVLPLALLNFNGKKEESSVTLQWQTTNEINSRQFIIQRSSGSTFNDIGTIPAKSTKGINDYIFTDKNAISGSNLYRLKMIDIDGQYTYSNVIKINFRDENESLRIYPNPVTSILNLKINSNKTENTMLRITDASGKPVYQKIISANAGATSHSVNIETLPAGVYYLNLNVNSKSEKVSFVKE